MAVEERMIMSDFKMPIEHELWLKTDGKEGQQFNLAGKDFSNAILDKCLFAEASLSGARGLETVKLKWIDIGQNGCIKKLYGIEAIRWLQREAEKPL